MPIDRSDIYCDFLIKGMAWDLSRPSCIQNCKKRFTEKANADPNFQARMREVALEAIQFEDVSIVRNGLTALTFVGKREDIPLVERLTQHSNKTIVQDALTCLIELRGGPGNLDSVVSGSLASPTPQGANQGARR